MEPEFGKVFELFLQLRLSPDLVTFVPDTLLPAHDAFPRELRRVIVAAAVGNSAVQERYAAVVEPTSPDKRRPTVPLAGGEGDSDGCGLGVAVGSMADVAPTVAISFGKDGQKYYFFS